MKNLLTFLFLSSINLPIFAQTEQRIAADIQHVTVFLNKAQINATARTSVQAGTSKIIIENLATTTDPNSIQVGGNGDLVIVGVKFGQNYLKKRAALAVEDSLKQAKNEIETIEMLGKVADNERIMLMANANIKTEKDGISAEQLKEMTALFRTKLTEIGTRQLQLQHQLQDLQDRKKRLELHLNDQNINQNQPSGEIIVTVLAKNATNAEFNLTYIVNGAGWTPLYDLRATNIKNPIALSYRANVYQNTGSDWKNVRLTLSSSNPAQGGNKPELNSQFLTIYEPRPVVFRKAMSENQPEQDAAPAVMASMGNTANYTTISESTLAVNFDIALPYSIRSGNNPELVDIQNYSLPAQFSYSSSPKIDKDAFLLAKVSDWEKYNLLSGPANVYFEGTLVGTTQISAATTDSLMISLGRDKKILAKRETIADFKNRKSIGSSIKENFGYRISLRNTKSEPITLTVEDQFPVTQDSRIEIELLEATGGEVNKETGKITWKINLDPNSGKDLVLKYSVKYPKGKIISNL